MDEFGPILCPQDADAERLEKIALAGEIMLRDLHDMASKWGDRHAQRDDLYILNPEDFGVKTEITVKAKTDPNNLQLFVKSGQDELSLALFPSMRGDSVVFTLRSRQVIRQTASRLSYPETLPRILVFYDTRLTLEEVFNFMNEMMVAGRNKGLVEEGGKRRENPDRKYFVPTKLKVEEVFKNEESNVAILPGDNISETLEEFDKPEELVVIENPYTGAPIVITHQRWAEYHKLRFRVANEVFLEMGINPLDLAGASAQDPKTFQPLIERVRDEIERRTKEVWGKRKNSQAGFS